VAQWRIVVDEVKETPTSLVAFGRRDVVPVVLKLARRSGDEWGAGSVIQAFAGRGMVRVFEVGEGAVLLERLVPGTELARLSLAGQDEEATDIVASVVERLVADHVPPGVPTIHDWAIGFARYLESGDSQIPRSLVEPAQAWYLWLANSQNATQLLHGDLQHYNILQDSDRGWVAIDPKGVVGEQEYELGASFRNPAERLAEFVFPRMVERRLTRIGARLSTDLQRVLAWTYAQAVLSALWMVEDGHPVAPDDPTLQLAEVVAQMLPPPP
jgi:streptomycin 6-kinase